jgi:predicted transcriptional regulator
MPVVRHSILDIAGRYRRRSIPSRKVTGYEHAAARRAICRHLDKSPLRNYPFRMNIIRRTLDIDTATDARLRAMADERGQDVAAVLAEAVALLDSVIDIAGPDIAEDRRRLDAFERTRSAVPLGEVRDWVASWGSANELPRPAPRKIG